ncbi:MAG: Hpt domain-containing protein [Magnetospirillum sp.]|nr:Hpt domain-containing protein [Magnetospirillum sp.]
MTDDSLATHPNEIPDQLRQEFIDETVESLQSLDLALDGGRKGRVGHGDIVTAFRRAALTLRGQAANFGMGALSAVAHRLDEYLTGAPKILPPRTWQDLQAFLDLMLELAERQPPDANPADLVRGLPPKLGFDLGDIEIRNVEVMLVMPQGAQTRFVERELQQCGYRVSIVPDTILAFALVTQTKPDLIIVSAVMPALDGIDLAIALASMPSTRNIPMAVITSLDPDDERLRLLPRKIPVLHKGPSFADDLFKALDDLFLI